MGSTYLDLRESVYAILILSFLATGEPKDDDDWDRFNICIKRMKLFDGLTTEKADKYTEKFQSYLDDSEWEELAIVASRSMSSDVKKNVFANSADLIMANGFIPENSTGFLEMIGQAMQLEDSFQEQVKEIIKIKNNG